MLVLSRNIGERIVVPHCGLTVTIIAVKGKAVRLGIEAPAEIAIFREELIFQVKGVNNTSPHRARKPK